MLTIDHCGLLRWQIYIEIPLAGHHDTGTSREPGQGSRSNLEQPGAAWSNLAETGRRFCQKNLSTGLMP